MEEESPVEKGSQVGSPQILSYVSFCLPQFHQHSLAS